MTDETTFWLQGEVDLSTKPEIQAALAPLIADGSDVVVDCTDLTFIDSSGVAVLIEARNALEAHGHRLRIVNLDGPARRVFQVLGLEAVLGIDGHDPT